MPEDTAVEKKAPGLLAIIERFRESEREMELLDAGVEPDMHDHYEKSEEREAEFLYGEDFVDEDEERMILKEIGADERMIETIVARSVKHVGMRNVDRWNVDIRHEYEEWGMAGYLNEEYAPLHIITEEAFVSHDFPARSGRLRSPGALPTHWPVSFQDLPRLRT